MVTKKLFKIYAEIFGTAFAVARSFSLLSVLMYGGEQAELKNTNSVLLIPGLMASDNSFFFLQKLLAYHGFKTQVSGITRNLGSFELHDEGLSKVLCHLYESSGRPVDIVGWSMGGRFACKLAAKYPDKVGKVITLGSPLGTYESGTNQEKLFSSFEFFTGVPFQLLQNEMRTAISLPAKHIPLTAIVARWDAVVPREKASLPVEALLPDWPRENILVNSTHLGLGISKNVGQVIMSRLQQEAKNWQAHSPAQTFRA